MVLFEAAVLVAGLAIITYASEKSVEYSTHIAHYLKVSPLVIGVFLVSIGTDFPEIVNSLISSYSGHGDINVGNALGSTLAQLSLVLGLVVLITGRVVADRRNILVLGGALIFAVSLSAYLLLDGVLNQNDAVILIIAYIGILIFTTRFTVRRHLGEEIDLSTIKNSRNRTFLLLFASLIGVLIGSVLIVESVIRISTQISLPEYLVSFFVIGLGTSLPELSVEIAAARKKQYGIMLGDLMGSNITDATLALGIGPLFFPAAISGQIITPVAIYILLATFAIVGLFWLRGRIEKVDAILLILIYLTSYSFIF